MHGRNIRAAMLAFSIFAVVVVFPMMAFAQDASTVVTPFDTIYKGYVEPIVLSIVGVIVTAIIAWVSAIIKRYTGIDIEAKYGKRIHDAVMTGVSAGLTKAGIAAADFKIDVHYQIVADAVNWTKRTVPDALDHFGMTAEEIQKLALSKVGLLAESGVTPFKGDVATLAPAVRATDHG
jgi:hypothetical protein